jgi:hypothetical protein
MRRKQGSIYLKDIRFEDGGIKGCELESFKCEPLTLLSRTYLKKYRNKLNNNQVVR